MSNAIIRDDILSEGHFGKHSVNFEHLTEGDEAFIFALVVRQV